MRRFLVALAALSLPMTVLADADKWRTIDVAITLQSDGSLSVVEHASELIPEDMTLIKRSYWRDSDEHMKVIRVMRVGRDGKETAQAFDVSPWGQLQIKVPRGGEGPQYLDFRVETLVTGVVTPVWSIRRGARRMDFPAVVPPLDRLKEIVSMWQEAGSNPNSRYLLDYQFFFPDDQENPDVRLTLSLAPEWRPVHTISPDAVAHIQKSPAFGYADSLRVSALFDYAGTSPPATVDIRAHRIRMLSIAAFPIIAALIWLIYLGRRTLLRLKMSNIDETWLREHVFNAAPEVIAARWGNWPPPFSIETFLRRLEREGKIALDVRTVDEGTDDEDKVVSIRLRVPRERLSEYDRRVIDALMPTGNQVDSRDIQQRHAGTDFDPMASAEKYVHDLRDTSRGVKRSPRLSRLFAFALFAAGMSLIVIGMTRNAIEEPVPLFATLIFLSPLVALWPSRRVSWIWIPLFLMFAFLAVLHSITPQPLGTYSSLGVLLALIGAFHAMAAGAAVSGKPPDLVAAEAWLRSQRDHVRSEWQPYREALGLEKARSKDDDEDWGWTLSTFAASSGRQ